MSLAAGDHQVARRRNLHPQADGLTAVSDAVESLSFNSTNRASRVRHIH